MPNHWSGNLSAAERSNPSRSRLEAESRPLFFFSQAGNGPTRGLFSGWTVRLARHCCLAIYLTGKRCGFARCIENKKVKCKQSNSTHLPSLKGLLQSIGEHFSLSFPWLHGTRSHTKLSSVVVLVWTLLDSGIYSGIYSPTNTAVGIFPP